MKFKRNYYIQYLFICLFIISISYANEGSVELCSINTFGLNYSESSDKLYLSCCGSTDDLDILVVEPDTFQIEKTIAMNGYITDVRPIDNGDTLIVLLSMIVGSQAIADGKLIKIDYDTGNILNEYYFPNNDPLAMVIDPTETYVYVTRGLNPEPQPMLSKISLSNFQLVDEVEIGETGDDIKADSAFTKLYIKTGKLYDPNVNDNYSHFEIEVIDPTDLEKLTPVCLHFGPDSIEVSNDGRLFASYLLAREGYPGIFVVDTQTNQIEDEIVFNEMGVRFMSYDASSQTLVGTLWPMNFWDETQQEITNGPSNMIAVIDLTDPYYCYDIVTLGSQNHWSICTVPSPDPAYRCRVLTSVHGVSQVVYYKDIEYNY